MNTRIASLLCIVITMMAAYHWRPRALLVTSGSMSPALPAGSIALVVRAPEYEVGQMIAFRSPSAPQQVTTHRIVGITGTNTVRSYRTKGDANQADDSALVEPSRILGSVVWHFSLLRPLPVYATFSTSIKQSVQVVATLETQTLPGEVGRQGTSSAQGPLLFRATCSEGRPHDDVQELLVGNSTQLVEAVTFAYTHHSAALEGVNELLFEVRVHSELVFALNAETAEGEMGRALVPVNRRGPVELTFITHSPLCLQDTFLTIDDISATKLGSRDFHTSVTNLEAWDEGAGEVSLSFALSEQNPVQARSYEAVLIDTRTQELQTRVPEYHHRASRVFVQATGREDLLLRHVPPGDYHIFVRAFDAMGGTWESATALLHVGP